MYDKMKFSTRTARYILITSFKDIAAVPTGMNKCNTVIIKTSEDIRTHGVTNPALSFC
jgi:hypothetical protein